MRAALAFMLGLCMVGLIDRYIEWGWVHHIDGIPVYLNGQPHITSYEECEGINIQGALQTCNFTWRYK